MLYADVDGIVVVALVELVPWMEDIVDDLYVFRWIAYLIVDYPGFVHQQLMIDKDVLCAQIKCVSSKVVQLVDIYPIYFVAYQLELP